MAGSVHQKRRSDEQGSEPIFALRIQSALKSRELDPNIHDYFTKIESVSREPSQKVSLRNRVTRIEKQAITTAIHISRP
jgi:hypothetical protein